jgi:lipid II:glycine glycyltransferase (peptidoglycan interpeptide bridge formation enzyme)
MPCVVSDDEALVLMNSSKQTLNPENTLPFPLSPEYTFQVHSGVEDDAWDTFLASLPGAHYTQSSRWGRVKALAGWRASRLIVTKARRIVGGAQMLLRPLPVGGMIAYLPKGFVLAEGEASLSAMLLREIQEWAREQRVQHLTIQPPRGGEEIARQLSVAGFRLNPQMGTITSTLLIDLSPDPETLLSQMQKSTRVNIRRGEKRGIRVREGDAEDLDTFYRLLEAASRRKGFSIFSEKYYRQLWEALAPAGFLKIFVAEFEGEAMTAMLAIPFGDTVYSHISAWSGLHAECKPNETLEWQVMLWAKEHGFRFYDFEGINLSAATAILQEGRLPASFDLHKDRTVTQYKLGFGGQVVLLPGAYEYVFNPLLRWAYFEAYSKMRRWGWLTKAQKKLMRRFQPKV